VVHRPKKIAAGSPGGQNAQPHVSPGPSIRQELPAHAPEPPARAPEPPRAGPSQRPTRAENHAAPQRPARPPPLPIATAAENRITKGIAAYIEKAGKDTGIEGNKASFIEELRGSQITSISGFVEVLRTSNLTSRGKVNAGRLFLATDSVVQEILGRYHPNFRERAIRVSEKHAGQEQPLNDEERDIIGIIRLNEFNEKIEKDLMRQESFRQARQPDVPRLSLPPAPVSRTATNQWVKNLGLVAVAAGFWALMHFNNGFDYAARGIDMACASIQVIHMPAPKLKGTAYAIGYGTVAGLGIVLGEMRRRTKAKRQAQEEADRRAQDGQVRDKIEYVRRVLAEICKKESVVAKQQDAFAQAMMDDRTGTLFAQVNDLRERGMLRRALLAARINHTFDIDHAVGKAERAILRARFSEIAIYLKDDNSRQGAFAARYGRDPWFSSKCDELFTGPEDNLRRITEPMTDRSGAAIGDELLAALKQDYAQLKRRL